MNPQNICIRDYQYELPDERIAKYPIPHRDHSKLLVYRHGEICEDLFYHLPNYLPKQALMIYNNTRVIQARLHFQKSTGALIEIFLIEPILPADYEQMFQSVGTCQWQCMVGNAKKWKNGSLTRRVDCDSKQIEIKATHVADTKGGLPIIEFTWEEVTFSELLEAVGELPIPPYLNRETEEGDKTTYQTVYSKIKGSVAAPTAGLHFTENVLREIDRCGILRDEVTLHVGAGTFKPVKSEMISGHEMHSEYICVRRESIENLIKYQAEAIAVGTTSVRTLESLYYIGVKTLIDPHIEESQLHVGQWEPYENHHDSGLKTWQGIPVTPMAALQALLSWLDRNHLSSLHASTQIIIIPGYQYKMVKMLITNFHQPQSTLLLLVSALIGNDWHRVYDYALDHDFRFLSYGDSSLLIP